MPVNDTVTHVRGDTFQRSYVLTIVGGGAVDLTPWTVTAQVRTVADAPEVLADMTVAITQPAESGVLTLSLTAEQTAALPVGKSVFDIQLADAVSGEVWTPVQGVITVVPDVTRG